MNLIKPQKRQAETETPPIGNVLLAAGKSIVDENSTLEVGKFYNVKCAKLTYSASRFLFIPVIGIVHKDEAFAVNYNHVHIDGRFVGNNCPIAVIEGKTNHIIDVTGKAPVQWPFVEFIVKKKKCLRLETGIKPPNPTNLDFLGKPQGLKYWTWYKSMVGKSCKGKKCPHLGTKMHEVNGQLICPLHNLIGDKKTEVIVDRDEVAIACR